MNVIQHPLSYYVDRLANGRRFSQGMYGDGEWIAIFCKHIGRHNAEKTEYTRELCVDLRLSLQMVDDDYLFSVPEGLKRYEDFEKRIDEIASDIPFVDKDVWDIEVRTGGFIPLIQQLQKMRTCIISNANLRRLKFMKYDDFIEVSYPNCYSEVNGVLHTAANRQPCEVYLVSAGLPAALITQRLHVMFPNSFCLDLGSVWDAFCGIGGQRGWRAELYADKEKYREWLAQYESVGVPQRDDKS